MSDFFELEGPTSRPTQAPVVAWEQVARQFGFTDFLTPEDHFRSCTDTRLRWPNRTAPGIYFWIAENGEAYVGQSVQPQARLRQHMRAHGDLVKVAFRQCGKDDLDHVEARLVCEIGKHFALRNIKLAVSTASDVPFDEMVSPEEQQSFLGGDRLSNPAWRELSHLSQLQARKFEKFAKHSHGAAALTALHAFVDRALPKPAATEVGFWSVSLRPQGCFIRVNAGQQEVFTHEVVAGAAIIRVLTSDRISMLRSERMRYQTTSFATQVPPQQLERWLTGRTLQSARRLIIQLMRHTQALNSGSHCPQAVRFVLSAICTP